MFNLKRQPDEKSAKNTLFPHQNVPRFGLLDLFNPVTRIGRPRRLLNLFPYITENFEEFLHYAENKKKQEEKVREQQGRKKKRKPKKK